MEKINFIDTNILSKNESAAYTALYTDIMRDDLFHKSVYLWGPLGTGKTFLAACAANTVALENKKVAFIHYPSFVAKMTSMINSGEYQDWVYRLTFVPFLVIDEIGGENVTAWNRDSILFPILNARYEEKLPTWFTSNQNLEGLKVQYRTANGQVDQVKAERICERIESMSIMKTLNGNDRRKKL